MEIYSYEAMKIKIMVPTGFMPDRALFLFLICVAFW